ALPARRPRWPHRGPGTPRYRDRKPRYRGCLTWLAFPREVPFQFDDEGPEVVPAIDLVVGAAPEGREEPDDRPAGRVQPARFFPAQVDVVEIAEEPAIPHSDPVPLDRIRREPGRQLV